MNAKKILAHDPTLLTEAELSSLVVEAARLGGWKLRYHTGTSRKTKFGKAAAPGFPDWVLVKPPRLIFAELKSETGPIKPEQREWLDALSDIPGVECYLWRPTDWDEIVETLTGKKPRRIAA